MLETMIDAIAGALRATFLAGDRISLVIALAAILVAVSAMKRTTQIGSVTLFALLLYVVGKYVYGVFVKAPAAVDGDVVVLTPGSRAATLVSQGWSDLASMSAITALAYFFAFMMVIWIIFALRSMVTFSPMGQASAGHGGGH